MKISVIIPVLNEQKTLSQNREVFEKLVNHCHELIIVDGGSSDNTVSLARKITPNTITSLAGRARQMNSGAAIATGDVLLFLHVDSSLPDNALEKINNRVKAGAAWGYFNIALDSNALLLKTVSFFMNIRSSLTSIATGDQCLYVKRDLFDVVGGYPDIPLMEDITLSIRLKKHSVASVIKDVVITSARRWQDNGSVKTILFMWWVRLRYWLGESPSILADKYYPNRLKFDQYVVYVFAKSPGQQDVKTRLSSILSTSERQSLHVELISRTLTAALSTGYKVVLWTTDIVKNTAFYFDEHFSLETRLQQGGDLGERMFNAIKHGLRSYKGVILIGTDCPAMTADYISDAIDDLENNEKDIVIGPAEDGGYVLIACRRCVQNVFDDIEWGTSSVLSQTVEKLERTELDYSLLDELWDVDRPEDYQRFTQLDSQAVQANA